MKYVKNKKFVISILILMLGQSLLYWLLKLFQSNPHYITFYFDDKIPLIPQFVYIYNLFYPFVFVALCYLFHKDEKNYYYSITAGTIGYIICDIIFLCYPTIMKRMPITSNVDFFTKFVLNVTYYFDEPPLNCFPSIHCLFCFQVIFSYLQTSNIKSKEKVFTIILALLIISSTVLIKQHYFFDIIGALLICLMANIIAIKTPLARKFQQFINKI